MDTHYGFFLNIDNFFFYYDNKTKIYSYNLSSFKFEIMICENVCDVFHIIIIEISKKLILIIFNVNMVLNEILKLGTLCIKLCHVD
jgi:hypothetical protein